MAIQVKEIIGTPDNKGWVQVHHFAGLEADKKSKRGQMVLLLALKGASEEAATGYGREIISRVYEEYYGNLEERPMARLKQMLGKIGKERPVYLTEKISLSLLIAIFWRGFWYFGIWGQGQIFLSRKGGLLPLLQGESKQVLVISGQLKKGDLVLLGTDAFFAQIPQGTIRASLQGGNSEMAAEVLSPLVHARPNQSQIGAALVQKSDQKELREEKNQESASRAEPKLAPPVKLKSKFQPKTSKFSFSLPFSSPLFNLVFGLVLLASLLGLVGWGIWRQKKLAKQKEFDNLIAQVEDKLQTAESIQLLETGQSLGLAKEAQVLIVQAAELKENNSHVLGLKERAEKLMLILGGGEKLKPEIFFRLSLLAEGAEGQQLVVLADQLFVFDPKTQKVFGFEYPQKHSQTFSGGQIIKDKQFLTVVKNNRFYFLDDQGIVFWDGKGKEERVAEHEWSQPKSLLSWGNNFYVLDVGEKKLLKLVGLGQGYASPGDWFVTPPALSWEKIKDVAIDGHIWFLTEDGRITRFFQGRLAPIKLENNPSKSSEQLALATEGSRLAIFNQESQLLVWDKEGHWQGQLNIDLAPVIDMAISPEGRWLFFLTKGEVYWLDLNEALLEH